MMFAVAVLLFGSLLALLPSVSAEPPTLIEITFYQLDWYVSGSPHTLNSSWGRMDMHVTPDLDKPYYLNVVAYTVYEPTWIIQNYPILPEVYGVPNDQAVHFNIAELGILEGTSLDMMHVLIATDPMPLHAPPEGSFEEVFVNPLIRDAWGHGDGPPAEVGEPVGHKASDKVTGVIKHKNVPSVQEDDENCITGSYARSIKWLESEYDLKDLDAAKTAQQIYDDLTVLGIGHGTGRNKTEEEMLKLKADYLEVRDDRAETKFVDYGYLGNVAGVTEVTPDDLADWLSKELKTEDVEMFYDGHCVTITGMYRQGDKVFLEYRDDEEQNNPKLGVRFSEKLQ